MHESENMRGKRIIDIFHQVGSKRFFIGVLILAFVFPFFLCLLMRALSIVPGDVLEISAQANPWFAFYGSYTGIFVSIFLGIITLELTLQLDDLNSKNNKLQNQLTIAANMPNMHCIDSYLYSLDEGSDIIEFTGAFERKNNYIFSIATSPAFPPYFNIKINNVEFVLYSPKGRNKIVKSAPVESKEYIIKNNQEFLLAINTPKELDDIMELFYLQNLMRTAATPREAITVDLKISFECSNELMEDHMADVKFLLHLQLMNKGLDPYKKRVKIEVINRSFVRI